LDIQGQHFEQDVDPTTEQTPFSLDLKKGTTRLAARFFTKDNKELGAYYALVEKEDNK